MSSTVIYVGSFPPPYGGVTVKNALLYRYLSEKTTVARLDLTEVKGRRLASMLRFVSALASKNGALIVGTAATWRRRITAFLYHFNRKKLGQSIVMVMGGTVPTDERYVRQLSCYRQVFVETQSMKASLRQMGLENVSIYPNCRERPHNPIQIRSYSNNRLKCVFFSYVSPEKGIDMVLGAAERTPHIDYHIYGRIDESYGESFFSAISGLPNVEYHGVFNSAQDNAISELSKYDLHLFPSRWVHEGVPGVITETKMAGVPTIASNIAYNAELIKHNCDGIIMQENSIDVLVDILCALSANSEKVNRLKAAALESAEWYYVDNYIDEVLSYLS